LKKLGGLKGFKKVEKKVEKKDSCSSGEEIEDERSEIN